MKTEWMIAIMCSMYTSDRIFLNRSWFKHLQISSDCFTMYS